MEEKHVMDTIATKLKAIWNRYFAGVRILELALFVGIAGYASFHKAQGTLNERLLEATYPTLMVAVAYLRNPKSASFLLVSALSAVNPALARVLAAALGVGETAPGAAGFDEGSTTGALPATTNANAQELPPADNGGV